MVRIKLDTNKADKAFYFCSECKKKWKLVVEKGLVCPDCDGKLIHANKDVWRLVKALKKELKSRDLAFRLVEEVPLKTKHGFFYHADVGIWLPDSRVGLIVDLIPVNPDDGRYKAKIRLAKELQQRFDIRICKVELKECGTYTRGPTARKIVNQLVKRNDLKGQPF